MPGGRPPMYKTAEEMQLVIDDYFDGEEIHTVCGLALALRFDSRQSLINYEGKDEFLDTIKRAKMRIEAEYEGRLVSGKANVAGLIFNLKNNFSWKDAQQHDLTVNLPREINIIGCKGPGEDSESRG